MTKRKLYRLRSTVEPSAGPTAPSRPLRRQFWGISPRESKRMLAQQKQEFDQIEQQAAGQIALERAERERLQKEIASLKVRLQTAHDVVETLREKLARERAARAVLAARLLDQPADEKPASSRAADMRLQSVSLSVELQREHNALRDLVGALYRTVGGRDGIPADLSAAAGDGPSQVAAARQSEAEHLPTSNRWHKFLVGKIAGTTLYGKDGREIVQAGRRITPELLKGVDEAGLLFDLCLHMELPPSDQDL